MSYRNMNTKQKVVTATISAVVIGRFIASVIDLVKDFHEAQEAQARLKEDQSWARWEAECLRHNTCFAQEFCVHGEEDCPMALEEGRDWYRNEYLSGRKES